MTSRENGFATATLELLSGYPGHFYHGSDGSFICGVDYTYGLPIRLSGDSIHDHEWFRGYNRAISPYVEQYGLPWNSRLTSLDVLEDLHRYFHREGSEAVVLELHGSVFRPEGFDFSLSLSLKHGWGGFWIRLDSDKLFKDANTVPGAMGIYRSGPPPRSPPANPTPPDLEAGTTLVWLRNNSDAQRVECMPAPIGSYLVIFRFSEFTPQEWRIPRKTNEAFAALDTQLGAWIPGGKILPKLDWLKDE